MLQDILSNQKVLALSSTDFVEFCGKTLMAFYDTFFSALSNLKEYFEKEFFVWTYRKEFPGFLRFDNPFFQHFNASGKLLRSNELS